MDQCNKVYYYKTKLEIEAAIDKEKTIVARLAQKDKASHLALITCTMLNPSKCKFKGDLSVLDADFCNELTVNPCAQEIKTYRLDKDQYLHKNRYYKRLQQYKYDHFMTSDEWTWIGIAGGLLVFGGLSTVYLNSKKKHH